MMDPNCNQCKIYLIWEKIDGSYFIQGQILGGVLNVELTNVYIRIKYNLY